MERPRPHAERALVRPDQFRGQPRRGRKGVLLLPRPNTDVVVLEDALQIPAGRISLQRPGRDEPVAGQARPEYELLDTGVSTAIAISMSRSNTLSDAGRILMQVSVHNRGPDDAEVHLLPTLWFRHTWSWAGGTDQPSLRRLDESAEFRLAETGRSQLAVGGPGAGRFLRPGRNRDQHRAVRRPGRVAVPPARDPAVKRPGLRNRSGRPDARNRAGIDGVPECRDAEARKQGPQQPVMIGPSV